MPLTVKEIEAAKPREKAYKMADGEGMYLLVTPAGGKLWRLKYRYLGKENNYCIGEYPYITLAEARDKRFELKKMLEVGIDPNVHKKERRYQAIQEAELTVEKVARDWLEFKKSGWSKGYGHDVAQRVEKDIISRIGRRSIVKVGTRDIIHLLKDVESRGVGELAYRTKQTLGEIFRYAVIHEYIQINPVSELKSRDILKKTEKKHFNAIQPSEIPKFIDDLNQNKVALRRLTHLAIKLLMLTFVRTNELIKAEWKEFDLENKVWVIPASRMKMKRDHLVPLSKEAIEVIQEIQSFSKHQTFVFPSQSNPRKHMSDNTILQALNNLGYRGRMTGHGFRSLAMTTILEVIGGYRYEVADRQLAHAPKNKMAAAYDRTVYLDERKKMMQDWSDHLVKQGLRV